MHLFRPGEGMTMCGILLRNSSTIHPLLVDCKKCLAAWKANQEWYLRQVGREIAVPGNLI